MKGTASYTSSVLMSMSAAAFAAGDRIQVPTSATRMEAEERTEIGGMMVSVDEVELDSSRFFEKGIGRVGTDLALTFYGHGYPKVVVSHFTDIAIPEVGVELPISGFNEAALHKKLWCQFLRLEDLAKREALNVQDRKFWDAFSKYIDYGRYRAETAPLIKVHGTLVSWSEGVARVRWLGETEDEVLRGNLAERVSLVSGSDVKDFSAMARFAGYKLVAIEDVRPECDSDLSNDDLSWMTEWQNG